MLTSLDLSFVHSIRFGSVRVISTVSVAAIRDLILEFLLLLLLLLLLSPHDSRTSERCVARG